MEQKLSQLLLILILKTVIFSLQLIVALWSDSLSLMANSGHLFSDILALGVTILVAWLANYQNKNSPDDNYKNLKVTIGIVNSLSLLIIAFFIAQEAIEHLQKPEPLNSLPVLIIAILSISINGWILYLLQGNIKEDFNWQGIFFHSLSDTASNLSIIFSAITIYFFNWLWTDGVVSIMISIFLVSSAISLLPQIIKKSSV